MQDDGTVAFVFVLAAVSVRWWHCGVCHRIRRRLSQGWPQPAYYYCVRNSAPQKRSAQVLPGALFLLLGALFAPERFFSASIIWALSTYDMFLHTHLDFGGEN